MIKLGVTLPQFTADAERLVSGALAAESLGLDSIWLFDHLWPLGGPKDRPIFESWTTLAYVAARTERIRIGTLVTRSTLRNPGLLAKMAATVEAIAPGRLTVAIGSGDEMSRAENEAFDAPYCGGDDRIPEMASAIECVRECLHDGRATVQTPYHRLHDLPTSPLPATPPPIWVGGRSAPVREIAGRSCDGWNSWATKPEAFAREVDSVRRAAGDRRVELSWGGQVIVAEDDAAAAEMLGARSGESIVVGSPDTVAATFRALAAAGAEHLIAAFPYAGRASYELLAGPVRERLEG